MKEKRLAVIIGRCLIVCMLALPLNVMTASAEASDAAVYESVREAGSETEITIGVSGYVQLPVAVMPEIPGLDEPEQEVPDEESSATIVTPVADISNAAPQTGDDTHAGGVLLKFMLAGIMVALMVRQAKNKGTSNMGRLKNTL